MKDHIPIYTHLTITPNNGGSLKKYFNAIKRDLPKKWVLEKDKIYKDTDTFRILDDVFCLKNPPFRDVIQKMDLHGYIYLGLTDDSISLLRIELSVDLPKEKSIEIIGYIIHSLHEDVLKPKKYYPDFNHKFEFGGPRDENWFSNDLRDERSIKLHSKSDHKTYFLSKSEKVKIADKNISYTAPNNISLSLSLMKKSLNEARKIYKRLILKVPGKKVEIKSEIRAELYNYFEILQTSIIFSYIAIEGFSNAVIPENYLHERVNEKGIKETLTKENIERWMSTSEKVGTILPLILKTSDIRAENYWATFKELEQLRNDIVHQKTIEKGTKLDTKVFNQMLNPKVFERIASSIKVIDFFYKVDNAHPYFPLGFGIATFQVHKIESMEKHFKVIEE